MDNYRPTRMGNYSVSLGYNSRMSPGYKVGNSRGVYEGDEGAYGDNDNHRVLTAPKVKVEYNG